MHAFVALVSILAVLQFIVLSFFVGRARGKYQVPAPRTDGPEGFQRAFRVQQNTLEQLVAFLPSLWLFSAFMNAPHAAAVLGGVWLIGRSWYAYAYARGGNRFAGFLLNIAATSILAIGALIGIVQQLLAS